MSALIHPSLVSLHVARHEPNQLGTGPEESFNQVANLALQPTDCWQGLAGQSRDVDLD